MLGFYKKMFNIEKKMQNIEGQLRFMKNYQKENQYIVKILRISLLKKEMGSCYLHCGHQ